MNFPSLKRKKRFWSNKSYDFLRVLLDNAPTLVDANSDYSSSLFTLLEHYDNFLSLNMITLFQLFLELWIGIFIKITLRLKWYAIIVDLQTVKSQPQNVIYIASFIYTLTVTFILMQTTRSLKNTTILNILKECIKVTAASFIGLYISIKICKSALLIHTLLTGYIK